MAKHNPNNERIKRMYLTYLKEAKRQNESTLDGVVKALARFENDTKFRDFKAFRTEQAVAFKKHLAEKKSLVTGKNLSPATLYDAFGHLKRFFQWLSNQPGFKSRIRYSDAEYFSLSGKDSRVATASREKKFPTMAQIIHVIKTMPIDSEIERRNRAIVVFAFLTGARVGAIASLKLKHIDLVTRSVFQDARDVKTKFSKTFTTFFFPVGEESLQIVMDWVNYLREEKLWGNDDPLFPSTQMIVGANHQFEATGLKRKHWGSASPIRAIFREAFEAAGLPYFHPHSFRNTLVELGEKTCKTPEDFKAWSQNLGHEGVLTTFFSYGEVGSSRQGEIIRNLAKPISADRNESIEIVKTLLSRLENESN